MASSYSGPDDAAHAVSRGNEMSARHSYIMLVRKNYNITVALAPVHTDFLLPGQQYFYYSHFAAELVVVVVPLPLQGIGGFTCKLGIFPVAAPLFLECLFNSVTPSSPRSLQGRLPAHRCTPSSRVSAF